MSGKRWDVKTPKEGKDGKTFWTKCGAAFEGKGDSISIVLDALPVNGKLSLFIPKTKEEWDAQRGGGAPAPRPQQGDGGFSSGGGGESDIPFIVDAASIRWDRP